MFKKILYPFVALFMAIAMAVGVTAVTAPAQAFGGANIDPYFGNSGWWNTQDPEPSSQNPDKWEYDNFPVKCNNHPARGAYQILFVYNRLGQESWLDNNAPLLREQIRSVASIFAASSETVVTNQTTLGDSLAPRFVTWEKADGSCQASFTKVLLTYEEMGSSWTIVQALRAKGFTEANRKYHAIVWSDQAGWNEPGGTGSGVSYASSGSYNDPSPSNKSNSTSISMTFAETDSGIDVFDKIHVNTIAHEMTHDLTSSTGFPNQYNGGHVSDCYDILCYDPVVDDGGGQRYLSACDGASGYFSAKSAMRLDCQDNDYWAKPGNPSWATSKWTADKSAFLWGGGAQPTTFPSPYANVQPIVD